MRREPRARSFGAEEQRIRHSPFEHRDQRLFSTPICRRLTSKLPVILWLSDVSAHLSAHIPAFCTKPVIDFPPVTFGGKFR